MCNIICSYLALVLNKEGGILSRKSKRLRKFKKIHLRKNVYLTAKEKEFSKKIKSPSKGITVLGPSLMLKYIADELLNELIYGTGPAPKGLYGDLENEKR